MGSILCCCCRSSKDDNSNDPTETTPIVRTLRGKGDPTNAVTDTDFTIFADDD